MLCNLQIHLHLGKSIYPFHVFTHFFILLHRFFHLYTIIFQTHLFDYLSMFLWVCLFKKKSNIIKFLFKLYETFIFIATFFINIHALSIFPTIQKLSFFKFLKKQNLKLSMNIIIIKSTFIDITIRKCFL